MQAKDGNTTEQRSILTEGLAADARGRLPTEVSPRNRTGIGEWRRSARVVAQATVVKS